MDTEKERLRKANILVQIQNINSKIQGLQDTKAKLIIEFQKEKTKKKNTPSIVLNPSKSEKLKMLEDFEDSGYSTDAFALNSEKGSSK